jgi:phenylalanine-4-hydroxylase
MNLKQQTIVYSEEEHLVWHKLYGLQQEKAKSIAHPIFLDLLNEINLPKDRIPQTHEVSKTLQKKCGWVLTQVDGIISTYSFYNFLANKIFPSTTFIRTKSMGFNEDPDVFHELFGHATMLLDKTYAAFMVKLAKYAISATDLERAIIQRIAWFTIEVGLIKVKDKLCIYGGALLSSPEESTYSIESTSPIREKFDVEKVSRTPFRANMFNEYFYYIDNFEELLEIEISRDSLLHCVNALVNLKEYPSSFGTKENDKYSSINIINSLK